MSAETSRLRSAGRGPRGKIKRTRIVGMLTGMVVFCLAFSAHAEAASVGVQDGVLVYQAAQGEVNNFLLSISPETDGRYIVSEYQAPLTAGVGCSIAGASQAHCPNEGIKAIRINTEDGDDIARIGGRISDGGVYPPSIPTVPLSTDGGPGEDFVEGGLGDDLIDVRDGEIDEVECRAGEDSVTADGIDEIAADCEQVDNGTPPSPPGPVGISINAGADFTNDPQVALSVRWPRLASQLFLSNDGGFDDAALVPVAQEIEWQLRSTGPERLPKTVYARFSGGDSGPETYQDDIILDETNPVVESASIAQEARSAAKSKKVQLRIKAEDKTSGVNRMQITNNKKKPGEWAEFKTKASFKSRGKKIYVRVQDGAKNKSGWKRAKV